MLSPCTGKSTIFGLVVFLCIALCLPGEAQSEDRQTRHLFRIERSKNDNIVQYDVQVRTDGTLDPKEPVVAYWIRLAENGQKQSLKWLEKKFAYGFRARYDAKTNSATLDMVAKIRRTIKVHEMQGEYRAETAVEGRPAYLEKIYISSKGKGLSTEVVSIELFGEDKQTGEERYEKIDP